jgi:uncharacterized protein (DUF362 family)
MIHSVYVVHGDDPAALAYEAAAKAFTEDPSDLRILLKVNTGFKGPAASGLCTHPEFVRGLLRFFQERHAKKLYVGDSSIVGTDSIEALKSAGIWDVCREEGVECLNLDESGMEERTIPGGVMVDSLKLSRLPFEVDRKISVPVMKTHMYATATLGLKNMKGCLYQRDKTRLHRILREVPDPSLGKGLDYGIADLAKICYPDYTIIDGYRAMEGFGPSGGTPVEMHLAISSACAVAADITAVQLMGMARDAVPHIELIRRQKGVAFEDIQVFPEDYLRYARKFRLADEDDLHLAYRNPTLVDRGACSACHAAWIQFLRYHHQEFEDGEPITVGIGRDLTAQDLGGGRAVAVGNCTARLRDGVPFCKGCPPVPSQIARTIHAGKTLDD